MKTDKIENRDVKRAEKAKKFIDMVKEKKNRVEIRNEIEALPARIRINGLTQCLMYLLEKDKEDRNVIGKEIVEYLSGEKGGNHVEKAVAICASRLRQATAETFGYSRWLKLMAKAQIEKPNNEKSTSQPEDSQNDTPES